MSDSEVARCGWAGRYTGANKEDYVRYHDEEWGLPVLSDDRHMFEMICLEGAQAGLSWATILAKRSGYKQAFNDFDVDTLVRQASKATSIDELVDAVVEGDFDVVRSRRKIESVYRNAAAARTVQGEYGSLCEYIWHFTEGRQIVNTWKSVDDIPSHTELSERVAKDMKARGFRYPNPLTGPSSPFDDPSIMQALPGGSPKYPYVGPRVAARVRRCPTGSAAGSSSCSSSVQATANVRLHEPVSAVYGAYRQYDGSSGNSYTYTSQTAFKATTGAMRSTAVILLMGTYSEELCLSAKQAILMVPGVLAVTTQQVTWARKQKAYATVSLVRGLNSAMQNALLRTLEEAGIQGLVIAEDTLKELIISSANDGSSSSRNQDQQQGEDDHHEAVTVIEAAATIPEGTVSAAVASRQAAMREYSVSTDSVVSGTRRRSLAESHARKSEMAVLIMGNFLRVSVLGQESPEGGVERAKEVSVGGVPVEEMSKIASGRRPFSSSSPICKVEARPRRSLLSTTIRTSPDLSRAAAIRRMTSVATRARFPRLTERRSSPRPRYRHMTANGSLWRICPSETGWGHRGVGGRGAEMHHRAARRILITKIGRRTRSDGG
ncbi:hypothetical protein FOL46_006101 [Perkinsus olseni]|uniref:DNA-3-methyladenine glycosylase n=1 Tax=Perkinsus olseni TaxID=32597 RepID=A0A7J6LMJ6_PEROL|nr:hypothetical protein FOL46_006101 [Perkinsus olseni]